MFAKRVIEFFMLKSEELPAIVALHSVEEGGLHKFKYSLSEINQEDFSLWIEHLKEGKLTKFFQSDPIPSIAERSGIKIVVGKSFYTEILDNSKEVLLFIYSDQEEKSVVFKSIFEMIAEKLQGINITISMMNGSSNEYEGLEIEGFPSLYLFKGGLNDPNSKLEKRIIYDDEFELENIISFLEKNSPHIDCRLLRETFGIKEKSLILNDNNQNPHISEIFNIRKAMNDDL